MNEEEDMNKVCKLCGEKLDNLESDALYYCAKCISLQRRKKLSSDNTSVTR
ncbi:MAG: hypothetical protein QW802_03575 [Candidatus Altiarchaeota archaeon]